MKKNEKWEDGAQQPSEQGPNSTALFLLRRSLSLDHPEMISLIEDECTPNDMQKDS
jgi:hypothetical protein